MPIRTLLTMLILFACSLEAVQKHVHGEGQLLIAQESNDWQLQLLIPGADLLGFEHAPETPEQHKRLKDVITSIENVIPFISLPEQCELQSFEHSLGELESSTHHSSKHSHSHKHEDSAKRSHADISITYIFTCRSAPQWLKAKALTSLSSLSALQAQWITNSQQGARKLTPSSNKLRFEQ